VHELLSISGAFSCQYFPASNRLCCSSFFSKIGLSCMWTDTVTVTAQRRGARGVSRGVGGSQNQRYKQRYIYASELLCLAQGLDFTGAEMRKSWEWCPEAESNHRHGDFQSPALPTELSGRFLLLRSPLLRYLRY
jgi:hypothetical protein